MHRGAKSNQEELSLLIYAIDWRCCLSTDASATALHPAHYFLHGVDRRRSLNRLVMAVCLDIDRYPQVSATTGFYWPEVPVEMTALTQ